MPKIASYSLSLNRLHFHHQPNLSSALKAYVDETLQAHVPVLLTRDGCAVLLTIGGNKATPEFVAPDPWCADEHDGPSQAGPWIQLSHFLVRRYLLPVKVLPLGCRIQNLFSATLARRQLWRGHGAHGGGRQAGVAHTHTHLLLWNTYPQLTHLLLNKHSKFNVKLFILATNQTQHTLAYLAHVYPSSS